MARNGEKQLDLPKLRGNERMNDAPRARSVSYDGAKKRLKIELVNGVVVELPAHLIQIFQGASADDVGRTELLLNGLYIRWPELDEDLMVESLIHGTFGTPRWMNSLKDHLAELGKKGGRSRSKPKTDAARTNGAKGGRPRKAVSA